MQIFSTTGQLIRTIERNYYSSPAQIADLEWGISHESNNHATGVYMYMLKVKSLTDGTEDFKYQKMVIY